MRIVMMGTGPFAVPTFRALSSGPHEVLALVTRPVAPGPKGRRPPANPMREEAQRQGLPILEPEDVNAQQSRRRLSELKADLLVVCDYGQILSAATLEQAPLGGINLHASLLPKYRGAAPINWALLRGETKTGVTVIHMTPKLDGGPCLRQRETEIGETEDAVQLERRLSRLGVEPVLESLNLLEHWDRRSPLGAPQGAAEVTRAPRLTKADGQVNWTWTARRIYNHVRAMKPWPGSFTHWHRDDKPSSRIILTAVSVATPAEQAAAPGRVIRGDGKQLVIASGDGTAVRLDQVQPAGKKPMNVDEFLRGHAVHVGDLFQ